MAKTSDSHEESSVPRELRNTLAARMQEKGWHSIREFVRGARLPYSIETVRRAFNPCDYKAISPTTLAVVMAGLDYSQKEIKEMLNRYGLNSPATDLIGDQDRGLAVNEKSLLLAVNALAENNPLIWQLLADHLDAMASLSGVRVKKFTDGMRRSRKE